MSIIWPRLRVSTGTRALESFLRAKETTASTPPRTPSRSRRHPCQFGDSRMERNQINGCRTFCPTCGRRRANGKLEEGWLRRKDVSSVKPAERSDVSRVAVPCNGGCGLRAAALCAQRDVGNPDGTRLAAYVTPQQDDWPQVLLTLSDAEATSLQIIRLDCTYRTIQPGKSPVASTKKTQVIKATWRRSILRLAYHRLPRTG